MRAFLNLRYAIQSRREAFTSGLRRLGYEVHQGITSDPKDGDIFVTWNRIGTANGVAKLFEQRGFPVLVTENATWGNDFLGERWYHLARSRHNTKGMFPVGGPERWDRLNVPLQPFRESGETVILPQRGIGSEPTRMPANWLRKATQKHRGRVRYHPGTRRTALPLEQDLANCKTVVVWGSGAAIKALILGCEVVSYMPDWIGEQDNTEAGRLDMFRQLAWAQWTLDEISTGEPIKKLLT